MRSDPYAIRFKLNLLAVSSDIHLVLAPVAGTTYKHSRPVSRCHLGTREDVVEELLRLLDKEGDHPICWLNGPAGSGKSGLFIIQ